MPRNNLSRFFLSIVLPSILAIGLYVISIFVVILPAVETNIMRGKKEMISELTHSVTSLIEEYRQEALSGRLPADSARALAVERVGRIRYGEEGKDYFWIIDETPRMIMHPYRQDLIGKDLNDYQDPNGKLLFVESVRMVRESGEGFIDYMWQWKDDSTRIVPKLSYVQGYGAWDWVVGTGIYLEDVRMEINVLKMRLLRVALIITLVISILIAFMIRQSLGIERRRMKAESDLRLSRQKYKSLVEASTEGTLMLVNGTFIFSNLKFSRLSGFEPAEISSLKFEDLFSLDWTELVSEFGDPEQSLSRETILKCKHGRTKEVVISVSRVPHAGQSAYIFIIKEVSAGMQYDRAGSLLSQELQTLLARMDQPINTIASDIQTCAADATLLQAARLMSRKSCDVLFIRQGREIIGIVTGNDLNRRGLAEGLDSGRPVTEVMSAPVHSLPGDAAVYEGLLLMQQKGISHVALRGKDRQIYGVAGQAELAGTDQQTLALMMQEARRAEHVEQLAGIYQRLPVLIRALLESGSHADNLNRIITSLADAIHERVLELALESHGPPPCPFAFMVMGSLGRGEQTLATDQDNAIITGPADGVDSAESSAWFLSLGKRINEDLSRIGYHKCEGEIMAGNPRWNQDLKTWQSYFSTWIKESEPQAILETSIFFDFRFIYGDASLVEALRKHVMEAAARQSVFFYHMARSIVRMKLPVDFMGHIKSDATGHRLDLKRILLTLTSVIRLYAIREQIGETGSIPRADQLLDREVFDPGLHTEITEAYRYLTRLRIGAQSHRISRNEVPDNMIEMDQLNHIEETVLKKLIPGIAGLQTRLKNEFSLSD